VANTSTSRFNTVIQRKERYNYVCDRLPFEEARNKCLLVNLNEATEADAGYTGASSSSESKQRNTQMRRK
jgi:hypothetical protein